MSTHPRLSLPIRVSLALTLLLFAASGSSSSAQTTGAPGKPANATPSKNGPPRILFAESPALLILIDGDPVYRAIEGTDLERIVNTRALIVRDSSGIHYLKLLDGWLQAYTLTSHWSVSGVPPGGTETLDRAVDAKALDLLAGSDSKAQVPILAKQVPTIFISSEPAALIVTDGRARYQTVDGTSLEYFANTTATVFREPTDQELYVRVLGRWFRAWRTDGPWQFIPSDELPADIKAATRILR